MFGCLGGGKIKLGCFNRITPVEAASHALAKKNTVNVMKMGAGGYQKE